MIQLGLGALILRLGRQRLGFLLSELLLLQTHDGVEQKSQRRALHGVGLLLLYLVFLEAVLHDGVQAGGLLGEVGQESFCLLLAADLFLYVGKSRIVVEISGAGGELIV